ncbi:MAG: MOSC domain-containing protein [Rhizobiaceae bacterium]|jgi:MOSC domain-containing protein YiiM|nr:MOSC domain-containing protein [Rhizobiaceae bacterium]
MTQAAHGDLPTIHPARRIDGHVDGVYSATGDSFVTAKVQALTVTFEGIVGDHHAGWTRKAGGREPWYPRGTQMRNERQVSIVAREELDAIAEALGLPHVRPEWLGANIVVSGIPRLSMLPPRTLMFFGDVTLKVDGQNAPCRQAGKAIADGLKADGHELEDETGLALAFKDAAKRLRGLVAWVERPGIIKGGSNLKARLPEQWIYV